MAEGRLPLFAQGTRTAVSQMSLLCPSDKSHKFMGVAAALNFSIMWAIAALAGLALSLFCMVHCKLILQNRTTVEAFIINQGDALQCPQHPIACPLLWSCPFDPPSPHHMAPSVPSRCRSFRSPHPNLLAMGSISLSRISNGPQESTVRAGATLVTMLDYATASQVG